MKNQKKLKINLPPYKFILSGGGTGGHIYPAIAIANALKKKFTDAEFLFIGASGKMEMQRVPSAGYQIVGLPITGLQRKITLSNLMFPFRVIKSVWRARKIIKQFRPDVVIGTGGFASGPALRAAVSLKIPTLIQEQNAFPGLTNRMLANKATKICAGVPGLERYFPKEKIILTGNPVRQDILNSSQLKPEAYSYFQLDPQKKTLLVLGGSLGAASLNKAVFMGFDLFLDAGYQVIWQTGKTFIQEAREKAEKRKEGNFSVHDFIERMDFAYSIADLVVSRAGASSIAELQLSEKPCILIPSPNVTDDHQTHNAANLVRKEAALLIKDSDAENKLIPEAIALLKDESRRQNMSVQISKLAKPDAANRIANEVEKLIPTFNSTKAHAEL